MESYASGETAEPLIEETLGANLERMAREHADREALVEVTTGDDGPTRSLNADVDRVARGLLAAGIDKGDRVGIWSPNRAEWTLVQYATAKVGAILVNVNPAYRVHELLYVLNQSGLRLLFAATDFKDSDYRAMTEAVRADAGALERVVLLGTSDWEDLLAEGGHVCLLETCPTAWLRCTGRVEAPRPGVNVPRRVKLSRGRGSKLAPLHM